MKRQAVSGAVVLGVIFGFEGVGEYDAPETIGFGTIRMIQAAESEYHARHGYYSDPGCLARGSCTGDAAGPPLLEPRLEERIRRGGHHFEFHAGPPAATSSGSSGPALHSFAVVVRPLASTGVDAFSAYCGDASNRIYLAPATAPTIAIDGRCLDRSNPIFSSR